VPWNALYAPQFRGILAIGACFEAGLPSVKRVYDNDGAREVLLQVCAGVLGIFKNREKFPENFYFRIFLAKVFS